MHVVTTLSEYEPIYRQWAGKTIALVPTMGALHEGHASLIQLARQRADVVVVSIFVNPLQFAPHEDLAKYPRPREADLALCERLGVDVVFYPTVESFYPAGLDHVTVVTPPEILVNRLCGAFRPGHFTGVATVVLKLFNLLRPSMTIFGEKDAQQVMVIRKMIQDFHLPIELLAHPTVREADGLALSSRNRYLTTPQERQAALCLFQILKQVQHRVQQSPSPLPTAETLSAVQQEVLVSLQGNLVECHVQYLEAVDQATFLPTDTLQPGVKLLIAAFVNQVRLIDNLDL